MEIIIVDDGSSDGTAAIADEYEAKYPGICRAIHNNGQCCQQRNQKLIKPDSDTAGLCEILIECDQEQPIIKYDKQHKNDNRQHNAEDHILSAHSQNTAEHITVDIYIESTAQGSGSIIRFSVCDLLPGRADPVI